MKLRNRINKLAITLLLAAAGLPAWAQQAFKYRAPIRRADTPGFYKIPLSPDILALSNADLSDIRIGAANGKFVPYVFGSLIPKTKQKSFLAFPAINNKTNADTTTTLIIQNISRYAVDHLYLQLRNTAVQRLTFLDGSDDLEHWFAIKEDLVIGGSAALNGKFEQMINFPASTYKYLRLRVSNKQKQPLAILQAGIYQQDSAADPVYVRYPSAVITQTDSTHLSYVQIRFKRKFRIDKLNLEVGGPKFYKRRFSVYIPAGKQFEQLYTGELTSSAQADLKFSTKSDYLLLEIENGDSPPLSIAGASAFSLEQSLVAYLEKGQAYNVLVGDSLATAPSYDMAFFVDSLQRQLPVLVPADVEPNEAASFKPADDAGIPSWAIWVAIAIVGGVLLFLTLKMTKEVKKRDN